ncbi:hypothetical protein ACFL1G_01880 [Planctomycetota bacterium]
MFEIDLLKGQGVPAKSRPQSIAIVLVTIAVPVIITGAMLGYYLHNKILISIQKQRIVNIEIKTSELSEAVKIQQAFEAEKKNINNYLSEVGDALFGGRHIQWSPVLITVVENIPDSVVLTKLGVKQSAIKRKVPKKNDPEKIVSVSVPIRTLHMNVTGTSGSNCDQAIKEFRDSLYSSEVLGPKLDNIRVSQNMHTLEEQRIYLYEIECIFKPGL